MKDWRDVFNTNYDKELEEVAILFTSNQKLSSIGNSLEKVFNFKGEFILVGGLARRFHSSPRNTGDIDILFRNEGELRQFLKQNRGRYTQLRKHAITVDNTEVDLLTPEFLKIPTYVIDYVFDTKEITSNNINVASKEGVILLKLHRLSPTDDNDIRALIEAGGKNLKVEDILNLLKDKNAFQNILNQSEMFLKE